MPCINFREALPSIVKSRICSLIRLQKQTFPVPSTRIPNEKCGEIAPTSDIIRIFAYGVESHLALELNYPLTLRARANPAEDFSAIETVRSRPRPSVNLVPRMLVHSKRCRANDVGEVPAPRQAFLMIDRDIAVVVVVVVVVAGTVRPLN